MTPAQLRAFATVARTGSVHEAAATLEVSDAAVSGHVAALRRELDDDLFRPTASGLAFTPGGLRLAARAIEMLGLQDRTRQEVSAAGQGRRNLRVATTSLFGEYAAPGLIELFTARANDLELELVIESSERFPDLLTTHAADVTIGPPIARVPEDVTAKPFLKYQVVIVAAADHPLAERRPSPSELAQQQWFLGPSAAEPSGLTSRMLDAWHVPESAQRIFQSHAAAIREVLRGEGVSLALGYAVADDVRAGRLVRVAGPGSAAETSWTAMSLGSGRSGEPAAELMRFVASPRALQAMIAGTGANVRHFRPSVHITLWGARS